MTYSVYLNINILNLPMLIKGFLFLTAYSDIQAIMDYLAAV